MGEVLSGAAARDAEASALCVLMNEGGVDWISSVSLRSHRVADENKWNEN